VRQPLLRAARRCMARVTMPHYTRLSPAGPGAAGPRECHTMNVWDDKLVLFGGNDQTSRMNDIHILDTGACRGSRRRG
jgi:hypothetical protein